MSETSAAGLGAVYRAGSPAELKSAYASWSDSYDRETAEDGYCLPFLISAWVARYLPPGDAPLLDAGCGTGLSGPCLAALGYRWVEGLDFSPEMLAIASARGIYRRLVEAELGKPLPYETGCFAAVFSTGVFTAGHAPASSLAELARIVRPGGKVIATIRDVAFDRGGFAAVIDDLTGRGVWRPIERSAPFRAFAIGEPEVLVEAFVFEIA